ncbi:MAG: NAD(P)/FAD-dependent oxidoreductase [Deltaproteobacteria bacterium]|nr:MAG: NAD(P)/FAD-dependent oxidoreductase [Deltaproteobacteria bacterium]
MSSHTVSSTMQPANERIDGWLARFDAALSDGDVDGVCALFGSDCYWRDFVSLTWNLHTAEGHDQIRDMLEATLEQTAPGGFTREGAADEADGVTESFITFETAVGRGRGHLRLNGETAWTLLTTLQELKGHEEKTGRNRVRGVEHGVVRERETWSERLARERAELGYVEDPYVVIIGGGQGGIGLAARLRKLDIPTIVLEKNPRPGDSWRNRYESLHLHDPVWYDHLPYLPFPQDWPVFSHKDKIGDWLEAYTRIMELNYWTSTVVESASYDEDLQRWSVEVDRDGEPLTLHPTQLVFATGMSAVPNVPEVPGQDVFAGEQQHSSQHPGPHDYTGKKVVVIGSNNSAHDICAALWEYEADVTMVQRSSTHIARSDSLMELALGGLYSEDALAAGVTTDKADLIFASLPYRILPELQKPVYDEMYKQDKDFYDALEAAGFMLDFGEDGSGLFVKYLRRGSGYYIDVGASQLIIDGGVKLVTGQLDHLTESSVVLEDGTELPADLIVYATGYSSMNGWVAQIVSKEMADKVGKVWGMGSNTTKDPGPWEGELRNMWKPTRQDNLWFHGGNLHQSRHYSQFLALQLKARMEGLETPVHALAEVHHAS